MMMSLYWSTRLYLRHYKPVLDETSEVCFETSFVGYVGVLVTGFSACVVFPTDVFACVVFPTGLTFCVVFVTGFSVCVVFVSDFSVCLAFVTGCSTGIVFVIGFSVCVFPTDVSVTGFTFCVVLSTFLTVDLVKIVEDKDCQYLVKVTDCDITGIFDNGVVIILAKLSPCTCDILVVKKLCERLDDIVNVLEGLFSVGVIWNELLEYSSVFSITLVSGYFE
jgi:hypothetical protein